MVENYHDVSDSAWSRWNDDGRKVFNWILKSGASADDVPFWNGAFVAACEASGLTIEYEPRK